MPTNERDIIMEHVLDLDNKENLEMALDIISRSQEIRERIIKTFLEKLKGFICKKLDMSQWAWETGLCDKPYGKYRGFGVYSKFSVLQEPVYIQIQNQEGDLRNFFIGICSDPESNASFNASMKHLSSKLNEELEIGKDQRDNNWWIWYQSLKSPVWDYRDYTDWSNKNTLIQDAHRDRLRCQGYRQPPSRDHRSGETCD